MKQLTQKLKSGKMKVLEVPVPALNKGMVLVRNYYSLISAGTESSTVKAARKGYIGKARERPEQVKQVIDTLRTQGLTQTYRAVMKKLDAHSPLGYTCVGEVIDLASDIQDLTVGDFVACGGAGAGHSEVVSIPYNLCVKLNKDTDLKQAAYNTLGAIALQGVRQAGLRLGESCAVIGLGLLGQLTCIFLKASGVKVIGIDIDSDMVEIAQKNCTDLALARNTNGIESMIHEFTDGYGCDAVIITAGSDSLDPVNFAGAIAGKRGSVVVVGAVPTGFDREPHYYKKELILKMSCSYGPGRYDPNYEEKGIDYPVGYVRWTEKRNMSAFQDLIVTKKINIKYATTHTFRLEEAPKAYDMILEKNEPYLGILIKYDTKKKLDRNRIRVCNGPETCNPQTVGIGFIGAGSYAQSFLLPNIPKNSDVLLKGVMTNSSSSSRSVADRFGFEFCSCNVDDILKDESINTVFIATRHDSHGKYVIEALKAGKNIFVEKPLCLNEEQLKKIIGILGSEPGKRDSKPALIVGYNRRFAPLTKIMKEKLREGPMSMTYRVNAGSIPGESWIQDPEIGGGRIIGEVCHFIDYLSFINGSLPVSIHAAAMEQSDNLNDIIIISLKYQNGSIGSIQYFANGSKGLSKEYIEIYQGGITAVLRDFREIEIFGTGKPYKKKLMSQDKGQKNEVDMFINSIKNGLPPLIPFEEIINTTEVTLKVIDSLKYSRVINL